MVGRREDEGEPEGRRNDPRDDDSIGLVVVAGLVVAVAIAVVATILTSDDTTRVTGYGLGDQTIVQTQPESRASAERFVSADRDDVRWVLRSSLDRLLRRTEYISDRLREAWVDHRPLEHVAEDTVGLWNVAVSRLWGAAPAMAESVAARAGIATIDTTGKLAQDGTEDETVIETVQAEVTVVR